MAYSITDYNIIPEIQLHGILGVPLYLTNKMFVYTGTSQILPLTQFNGNALYAVDGCIIDGNNKVIPTALNSSFKLSASNTEIIYFWSKYSMQPPILISEIQRIIGSGQNNLSLLNQSPTINQYSTYKPSGVAPYSMGEWINYCHDTESGLSVQDETPSNNISYNTNTYSLKCVVTQKDLISADYLPNNVKVEFFNTTNNILLASAISTTFDFSETFNLTSTHKNGGDNNIQIRVYLKDENLNWILTTATNFNMYFERQTTYTVNGAAYSGSTFNLLFEIYNGGVNRTFEIQTIINNGVHDYPHTETSSTILKNQTNEQLYTFAMGHVINESTDVFTVKVKPSSDSTWITLYGSEPFENFPPMEML